jgi:hypothetical protein
MFHSPGSSARRLHCLLPAAFVAVFLMQLGAARAQTHSPSTTTTTTAPPTTTESVPTPTPTPTPYEITVGEVTPAEAGLNDEIVVHVNNLNEEIERQALVKEPAAGRIDPYKVVLFLNGVEMKKLYPKAFIPSENKLTFKLRRDDDTKEAWDDLLTKPGKQGRTGVDVGVGPEDKTAWPAENTAKGKFTFKVYDLGWLTSAAVLFLIALAVFMWLAKYTNIIRDSQPPEPVEGTMKPYSLARAQVAWWFFVILGSFLFILMVTGDYNTITTSSLVLLGIGSGTALGSAMVDANKRESANNDLRTLKPRQEALAAVVDELKRKIADVEGRRAAAQPVTPEELTALGGWRTDLAAKEAELAQIDVEVADAESTKSKPVSENFIKDVLSDVNGVTFHRFQIVAWTIVLGIIFIVSVWNHLRMPTFDETLLALSGISGATYLGFKIPERQNEPEQPQPASTTPAGSAPPTLPAVPAVPALPAPDTQGGAGDGTTTTGSDDMKAKDDVVSGSSTTDTTATTTTSPTDATTTTGTTNTTTTDAATDTTATDATATTAAADPTQTAGGTNTSGSAASGGGAGSESNPGGGQVSSDNTDTSDDTDASDAGDESDDDDSTTPDDADNQAGGGGAGGASQGN